MVDMTTERRATAVAAAADAAALSHPVVEVI